MKATISELWDTDRELITLYGSDTDRPQTISDLKKCDNIVVGARIAGPKSPYEVLIDNRIVLVTPCIVRHPCGGTMYILEVN